MINKLKSLSTRLENIRAYPSEASLALALDKINNRKVLCKEHDLFTASHAIFNQLHCQSLGIKVPVLYNCHNTGRSIIVEQEYIEGKDLFYQLLDKGKNKLPVMKILQQVLKEVKHYQKNHLSHLDIKLENIIWSEESQKIRVIDFDIMQKHKPKCFTKLDCDYGTETYSSPEVFSDLRFHPNTDLWHVGLIGYILVMGYNPFCLENPTTTRHNFQYYAKKKLTRQNINDDLKDLIIALIHPNPVYRSYKTNKWLFNLCIL